MALCTICGGIIEEFNVRVDLDTTLIHCVCEQCGEEWVE